MAKLAGLSETMIIAIFAWAAAVVGWLIRGEVKWAHSADRIVQIEKLLERMVLQTEKHDADLSAASADARQVSARLDRIEKKLDALNSYLLGRFAGAEDC